ncbi:MAG: hypothetical protein Q4C58_14190 [Eubacteriales bacterium]|nr:hypothetical protein [Eubacteriales bacterium]
MATAEEILAAMEDEEEVQEAEVFAPVSGYKTYDYTDINVIYVDNKTIGSLSHEIAVSGESDSQYLVFERDRYFKGIDLAAKTLQIHYERLDGAGDNCKPVNVAASDTRIRYGWIVPAAAMALDGNLKVMPFATGTAPTSSQYVLKDLYTEWTVHDGLALSGGFAEPGNDWYMQFVEQMQDYVSSAQTYADSAAASESAALSSKTAAAASAATAQAAKDQVAAQQTASVAAVQDAGQAQIDGMQAYLDGYISYDRVDGLAIKGTAEGTDIRVEDSADYHVMDLCVSGRSEQETTTGAQILDFSGLANISNSVYDVIVKDDGYIEIKEGTGTATAPSVAYRVIDSNFVPKVGTFTITTTTGVGSNPWLYIQMIGKDGSVLSDANLRTYTSKSFNFSEEFIENFSHIVYGIFYNNNYDVLPAIIRPMAYMDGDGVWEPYTGGKPSPNLDYPQEIISVGESGTLELLTVGKNLVDFNGITPLVTGSETVVYRPDVNGVRVTTTTNKTYGGAKFDLLKLRKNTTYRVSADITSMSGAMCNVGIRRSEDGGKTYVAILHAAGGWNALTRHISFSFNAGDYEYFRLCLFCTYDTAVMGDTVFSNIQVEEGSQETAYTPYKSPSSITIPLSGPLHGIPAASGGNVTIDGQQYVADRLEKRSGKYGVMRYCGAEEFDGSTDENWQLGSVGRYFSPLLSAVVKIVATSKISNALCDALIVRSQNDVADGGDEGDEGY